MGKITTFFKKNREEKEITKYNNIIIERNLISYFIELLVEKDKAGELKMAVKKVDKKTTEKDKPVIFVAFTNSEIQKVLSDWYHSAKLHKEDKLSTEAYEHILGEIWSKYIKKYTPEEYLIIQSDLLHTKIKEYVELNKN